MGERKVVSRKYALGIGVLCVVLVATVSGVLIEQNVNLQSQLSSDKSTINSLKSTMTQMNSTITNLEGQLSLDPNRIIDGFSIIQITDTQFLSDSYPTLYDDLTSWIADKADPLNLTMVIHTGDIVQNPTSTQDWKNASNAMITLFNNEVPYCWNAGNHDQINVNGTVGSGNPNGSWLGTNYPAFNVTMIRQKPYWVGDIFDGKNTAVQFAYRNYHFMIINIEYNANQTVLDWMQTLIKTNPNVNVIVATHDFLNGGGTYGTSKTADALWAINFEKLLDNYPSVFMTINGHAASSSPMAAFNKRVGGREEIFFNRQDLDKQQGAACARIYTFEMSEPSNAVVNVCTYQTLKNVGYLTDPQDQFSFTANLRRYSPSIISVLQGNDFLEANGRSVGFTKSATLEGFSQHGNALMFDNLTLNGVTSNFTVSAVGANILLNKYDPNSGIAYTVSGSGSQTFSTKTAPASVIIDGVAVPAGDGWSYKNGEVTVKIAISSVTINLT
jgi:hypothetical protein